MFSKLGYSILDNSASYYDLVLFDDIPLPVSVRAGGTNIIHYRF